MLTHPIRSLKMACFSMADGMVASSLTKGPTSPDANLDSEYIFFAPTMIVFGWITSDPLNVDVTMNHAIKRQMKHIVNNHFLVVLNIDPKIKVSLLYPRGAAVGVTKCNELKLALTHDLSYLCNTYLRGERISNGEIINKSSPQANIYN
ncbi:hypothetical protein YC2023_060985 [Brassica napus]